MSKHVLLLVGSPRRNGNSMTSAKEVLKQIEAGGMTGELVFLHEYEIKPCLGCNKCRQGNCVIKDDMAKLGEKMVQADSIVLITPVYLVDVPGIVKVFMDRTSPLRYKEMLKNKDAAIISIAECTGHESVQRGVANFMLLHGMRLLDTAICYTDGKPGSVLHHKNSLKAIANVSNSLIISKVNMSKVGLLQLNPGIQCFVVPFINGNMESCRRVLKSYVWPKFKFWHRKYPNQSHQTN